MGAAIIRSRSIALLTAAFLLPLGACDGGTNEYLRQFAHSGATPASFYVCYGYSCKYSARVALDEQEWQSVRTTLTPPATDASTERHRISLAVARLDQLVSARIGTLVHQRREYNAGDPSQYDCIDESVNTWTYLTVLDDERLLRFHRVGGLAHAGTVLGFDVRNTATLVANVGGARYAIDPTLVDPGEPPPVVPLRNWESAYPPEVSESEN